MPDKSSIGGTSRRVQTALKAVVEAELVRLKDSGIGIEPNVAWFSNGIIFSKSGNGTPFSNGIIFSKSGAQIQRPEESVIINDMVSMENDVFEAFADRLIKMKQTQVAGRLKG